MKNSNRRIIAAVIGMLITVLVGFCLYQWWYSSTQEVVITFGMFAGGQWDVPNDDCYKIIDEAIEKYEKENPGVRVEYVSGIQKDDYSEWISQAYVNGELPDVFMILPGDFQTFAETGMLKQLDSFIFADESFDTEEYYKGSYSAGTYNKIQYAIPYESNPTLMFVNTTLCKESNLILDISGMKQSEFYSACRTLTKDNNQDGVLDQFGVYNYSWTTAVYSNGASIFDEDTNQSNFTDEDVVNGVEFAKKLYQLSGYQSPSAEDFDLGKVAFRPMTFSEFRTYRSYPYRINKYANFEWDCTNLPTRQGDSYESYVENLMIGISSKTTKQNYAWNFLKEITYDETIQRMIFQYSQGVSPLKKVTDSEETQEMLDELVEGETGVKTELLDKVMQHGVSREKVKNYDELMDYSDGRILKMIMDNMDISSTLHEIKQTIDNDMKK